MNDTLQLKPFVPARDFAGSRAFYNDLGFEPLWEGGGLVHFQRGQCGFLLQDFYQRDLAENLMLHLLVDDVDAWHGRITASGLCARHGGRLSEVTTQPWGMRDFTLHDPSGVLWRIAQEAA